MNEDRAVSGQRLELERGSVAWPPCHIGKDTSIGENCSIGALVHIGRKVILGDNCRIQGGHTLQMHVYWVTEYSLAQTPHY